MKKRNILLLAMLFAAVCVSALPHGTFFWDFETDPQGNGSFLPYGYSIVEPQYSVVGQYGATPPDNRPNYHSATHSVNFTGKAANTDSGILGPVRYYEVGETITISAWIYNDAGNSTVDCYLYAIPVVNGVDGTPVVVANMNNANANSGWVQVSGTFTATTAGYYKIFFNLGINGNGIGYLDDFYVEFNGGGVYTLNVTSTGYLQPGTPIYQDTLPTNFNTNHTFTAGEVDSLTYTYTPGPPPDGYHWEVDTYTVVDTMFTAANNWTVTINFNLLPDDPLPVELSSFTAMLSVDNFVNLIWVTQSETNVQGYYVLRGTLEDLALASVISPLIAATNTSQQQSYLYKDSEIPGDGTYYYWLQDSEMDGSSSYFGPVEVNYFATGGGNPEIPLYTRLGNVYPNPFNPIAYIPYSLADEGEVSLRVINSRGQTVRDFQLGRKLPGSYTLVWNGTDANGQECPTGVYYLRLTAGKDIQTRKAVLVK